MTAKHLQKYFPNYLQWQAPPHRHWLARSHHMGTHRCIPPFSSSWPGHGCGDRDCSDPSDGAGSSVATAVSVPAILSQCCLPPSLRGSRGQSTTGKPPLQLQENPLHLTASASQPAALLAGLEPKYLLSLSRPSPKRGRRLGGVGPLVGHPNVLPGGCGMALPGSLAYDKLSPGRN